MRRLVIPAVFALFMLPALACGVGTPTAAVSRGGTATTAATAVPTAVPANVGKIGDTVSLKNYSLTIHAKQDPATSSIPASSGKRYVAYDLTITAITDTVAYNPLYAKLKLADNTEATVSFGGVDPRLSSGTLAKGEAARGWLTFEIASAAQPATFSYEILQFGTSGRVQFDVR